MDKRSCYIFQGTKIIYDQEVIKLRHEDNLAED